MGELELVALDESGEPQKEGRVRDCTPSFPSRTETLKRTGRASAGCSRTGGRKVEKDASSSASSFSSLRAHRSSSQAVRRTMTTTREGPEWSTT